MPKNVFIGIGSNLGSRLSAFNSAIKHLKSKGRIASTSFLYETAPLYYSNQNRFLNAVIQYQTDLAPFELLSFLKHIEKTLGRVSLINKGPRNIDLDILFYENVIIQEKELQIPHPGIVERDFVLEPLMDINPKLIHPKLNKSIETLHNEFKSNISLQKSNPKKVFLVPYGEKKEKVFDFSEKTYSMGIINVTPNSFHNPRFTNKNIHDKSLHESLIEEIKMNRNIFDIFDIGAEATNSHSEEISSNEEISRLLPFISAIKREKDLNDIIISLDSRKADVIQEILKTIPDSISIINDVSAGSFDNSMLNHVSNSLLPYVLMHAKGTPQNMDSLANYKDVVKEMFEWFQERISLCLNLGIPRWNLILDPGFGFAKKFEHHLEILRGFEKIKSLGFPILVGFSNKRFVKHYFDGDLKNGNSCLAMACVQKGANIIRIHEREILKAIAFANRIYKNNGDI